jgi:hypothetical protein
VLRKQPAVLAMRVQAFKIAELCTCWRVPRAPVVMMSSAVSAPGLDGFGIVHLQSSQDSRDGSPVALDCTSQQPVSPAVA